jgi:hypothetical protein
METTNSALNVGDRRFSGLMLTYAAKNHLILSFKFIVDDIYREIFWPVLTVSWKRLLCRCARLAVAPKTRRKPPCTQIRGNLS